VAPILQLGREYSLRQVIAILIDCCGMLAVCYTKRMKQRFAFLTLLLLVSALFIPFRILADSSTSLPSAAQALMQALAPPVITASVPPQASTAQRQRSAAMAEFARPREHIARDLAA
jgi:hypothetical protein